MTSLVMFADRPLSMALRRRGLAPGSPPPALAATEISRMILVKILPRRASSAFLRASMEGPLPMGMPPGTWKGADSTRLAGALLLFGHLGWRASGGALSRERRASCPPRQLFNSSVRAPAFPATAAPHPEPAASCSQARYSLVSALPGGVALWAKSRRRQPPSGGCRGTFAQRATPPGKKRPPEDRTPATLRLLEVAGAQACDGLGRGVGR